MTLKEQIGQRLIIGFNGTTVSEELIQAVKEYKIANIILFSRNIIDSDQLKTLCADIQKLVRSETGHSALIAIDQEGGIVTRLSNDCVNIPGAMALASTGDTDNAYRAGVITGKQLKSLGININFAPCVDVNSNPKNPVIGVRSFGDDPVKVGEYASAMIKGFDESGVMACVKHFPGHGDTDIDSHISLPCVDKSKAELEKCELLPYRHAIGAGVPAVMTAHILFPQLEPDNIPATMSRRIITDLLRKEMGFDGIVISDCMQMNAIREHFGTVGGIILAMSAGVDMVLVCHDVKLSCESASEVEKAVLEGRLDANEMLESAERIIALKKKWADSETGREFDIKSAQEENSALIQKTITVVGNSGIMPLGDKPLCIGCEVYRTNYAQEGVSAAGLFENVMSNELDGEALTVSVNPCEVEINAVVETAKNYSSVVVGTYNAHMNRGQLKLVNALSEAGMTTFCVAMQNPYDLADLPENVVRLAAFEHSKRAVIAVAKVLKGEEKPSNSLSVKLK